MSPFFTANQGFKSLSSSTKVSLTSFCLHVQRTLAKKTHFTLADMWR